MVGCLAGGLVLWLVLGVKVLVGWWVGQFGWSVKVSIDFWFGYLVGWRVVGSVEWSVDPSVIQMVGGHLVGQLISWSFGCVVVSFNFSICRYGF